MAEHPNVQRIRDAYAALAVGDLTAALNDLAPAGVLHTSGTGPFSGDHMGVHNIKTALVGAYALTGGTQKFEITRVFANDHHGLVVLRERAVRPDGARLDLDIANIISIDDDGRTTDIWNIPSDLDAYDRFFSGQ